MTIKPTTTAQFYPAEEGEIGQRIDNFLMTRLKGVPKSRIYRLVRKGEVRVNKKRIKPEYRIQAGDIIRIPPVRMEEKGAPAKPSSSLQQELAQRILFEDKHLLIIDKPAGVAVHGGSGISVGVIEALRFMRPHDKSLELVHRLDRETSGCLVLAKKPSTLKTLHALLRESAVEKTYLALVQGHWPKDLYMVDAPLEKFELRGGERMVKVTADGKAASTEFRVIQRFDNSTLVEAKPLTGRTHQIRVHALHVGHPIVGDDKYGDKDFNKTMRKLGCKRMFLHAYSIKFNLDEQEIFVKAEVNNDWQDCLRRLG